MFAKIRAFLVSFWNTAAESMITKGMGDWNVSPDNDDTTAEFFPEPDAKPPF